MGIPATQIPDNILRLMSPAARKPLGKAGLTMDEIDAKNAIKAEKDLHERIMQDLNRRGVTYQHERMDKPTRGRVGWPDFTFAVRGQAVAIECKAPGKHPEPEQVKVMAGLVADGWKVAVVHSFQEFFTFWQQLQIDSPTNL